MGLQVFVLRIYTIKEKNKSIFFYKITKGNFYFSCNAPKLISSLVHSLKYVFISFLNSILFLIYKIFISFQIKSYKARCIQKSIFSCPSRYHFPFLTLQINIFIRFNLSFHRVYVHLHVCFSLRHTEVSTLKILICTYLFPLYLTMYVGDIPLSL